MKRSLPPAKGGGQSCRAARTLAGSCDLCAPLRRRAWVARSLQANPTSCRRRCARWLEAYFFLADPLLLELLLLELLFEPELALFFEPPDLDAALAIACSPSGPLNL